MVVITSNVLNRVFRIRHGTSEGTGFTVDVNNRQYLVTARHVISGAAGRIDLSLGTMRGWTPISGSVVGHGDGDVDVSALALDKLLTPPTMTLPASSGHLSYGQDVYFLGFPYGFTGKVVLGPEGYPLPFVKKACLSQWVDKQFLLDGHNNPGFSGGPVVFQPYGESRDFKVAGVISGFRYVHEAVFHSNDPTPLTYKYNTGIISAFQIEEVVKLIDANPIGQENHP